MAIITTLGSLVYLKFFYVGNYPNVNSILSLIGKKEEKFVDTTVDDISESIMKNFQNDSNEKIMFVGSSQTWGAGASQKNKAFPFQFGRLLLEQKNSLNQESTNAAQILGISTENQFEIVNTGISGTTSNELLNEYEQKWINLKPKIVIINLSNNDFEYGIEAEEFEKNIDKFVSTNEKNNIKTAFMIEARSNEIEAENPYQDILFKIAERKQIPIINVDKYMRDQKDKGILWWDFIHPTDYGHQLIAKYLLEEINKIEPQISPQTSSPILPTN